MNRFYHILTFLIPFLAFCNTFEVITYKNLSYSNNYYFHINESAVVILEFSAKQLKFPPRVSISSLNASNSHPLMIVARQPKEILSWQLPLVLESDSGGKSFQKSSRSLCQDIRSSYPPQRLALPIVDNPILSLSTASKENVSFTVNVHYQTDFFVEPGVEIQFNITPSEPRYYFYNFSTNTSLTTNSSDRNYHTVILDIKSPDSICMTVSIQNTSCPVFDTNEDITFRGFYETVSTQGGITIPKYKFPYGFYIVFVAKPDDSDCIGKPGNVSDNRVKNITLIVKPSISYNDYVNAVIITLSCIGAFYLLFIAGFCIYSRSNNVPRQMEFVDDVATPSTTCAEDDISLTDESEYDVMAETETDKSVRLGKSVVYLSDLARKDPRVHKYKSYLYLYNVLTVALFYGLPAIQLVITYQKVLNETGEQDLCYYNFLCAHPLGVISDFNHVFSNVGYVFFGLLFLIITHRREITHQDLTFERQYGIPQHYGMFYAMGVALVMEGVLSGSYHVCPSQVNFQFDSSFMYVMAVLCMVKLYQNRHPDINATAYSTFGVLAIAILLGMIGIFEGNLTFWTCFTVIYILACLYLSIQIYYMGCWSFDRSRIYRTCVYDFWTGPLNVIKPVYKARMCLLILGNLCNWALAFWGIYEHQNDFALFLLAVFMANTLLYFCFYIVMKLMNKERVNKLSLFFLAVALTCAFSSMYFFLNKSISWATTPAQSRQFNKECELFMFYDYHDIWHFLSSIGMFFTFMVLLTLDDDLSHRHRSKIVVF